MSDMPKRLRFTAYPLYEQSTMRVNAMASMGLWPGIPEIIEPKFGDVKIINLDNFEITKLD